jgi:hypothetical protein
MRVIDPSRPNTHAFIGIGFQERDEAFEFENALRTHDKYAQRQAEIERQQREWAANHQDLSLKSGQTIQVAIKAETGKPHQKREARTAGGLQFNFAAPSAGSGFFAPPPSSTTTDTQNSSQLDWFSSLPAATPTSVGQSQSTSGFDFSLPLANSASSAASSQAFPASADDWTDFSSSTSSSTKNAANDSWANF